MQLIIDFQTIQELQNKLNSLLQMHQVTVNQENHLHIEQPSKEPFRKGKQWTQYEIDSVKDWYQNKTFKAKEMGKALGRTPTSVSQLIHSLIKNGMPPRSHRAGKVQILST